MAPAGPSSRTAECTGHIKDFRTTLMLSEAGSGTQGSHDDFEPYACSYNRHALVARSATLPALLRGSVHNDSLRL
ncbi:hypothetical protein Scel_24580 [Streptomyces cellostaticus]|nr:hypothetical protein Scel_24580 [Streptomyces cellostaticus]